jgi:hypothetical protein
MLRSGRLDPGPEEGAPGREIGIAERAGRHELWHEVPEQFFELGSPVEALPNLLEVGLEFDRVEEVELLVALQRGVADESDVSV